MEKDPSAPPAQVYYTAVSAPIDGPVATAQPITDMRNQHLDLSHTMPLPDTFTSVPALCCAFRCNNCSMPNCCGFKHLAQCLCLEIEQVSCKCPSDNPKVCCVNSMLSVEIVDFVNTFKCFTQLFCFEWVCGCPFEKAYMETPLNLVNDGRTDEKDIYPWSAPSCVCCGSVDSCYLKFPEMLGIYTNSHCCFCCYTSNVCLKPMCCDAVKSKPSLQFICVRNRHMIVQPSNCCTDQSQVLCFDHRCSCPYDDQLPCTWMVVPFFTFCVAYKPVCQCGLSLADIQAIARQNYGPPPVQQQPGATGVDMVHVQNRQL